ncbi:MAG TPA: CPBP family intramembrane glutamic endopeptidase [Caulobacteraceae bacterium]|nr:CPBP family intramembrane glutamic endopeptidase [Caulobacteraceae bacterium]
MYGLTFGNPWVIAVDGAARRTPGVLAMGLAVLALALGLLAGPSLYALTPAPRADAGVARLALDRLVQFACVLAPLYIVCAAGGLYERRAPRPGGWPLAPALIAGLGVGLAAFGATIALAAALGAVTSGQTPNPPDWRLGLVLAGLLTAFQAGGEELFFRGWLQPVLAARWGPLIGLLATALTFGLSHLAGRPLSPLALINDTLAGAWFGLLALRSGRLAPAFTAHFAWNFAEQSLAGATPNPGRDALGSLFDLDLVGPRLFSGGGDELNGAIETTAILGLAVVVLIVWGPSRRRGGPQ